MRYRNAAGASAHDAMHRLPGMPDHVRAGELNVHQHQNLLRNRPLWNRPLRNRPIQSPESRHRPARLAGWQACIGQRLRQGPR